MPSGREQPASGVPGGVVDLYCGAGGLSHGFALEGFRIRAGMDIDAACRHAYERNNGGRFLARRVEDLSASDIDPLFEGDSPRILVGCAPCQPYSSYNGKKREGDARASLFGEFQRLVREVRPDALAMENVPRLKSFRGGKIFADFLSMLVRLGYSVCADVVDCADYGVPQTRRRLVALASGLGRISLPRPERKCRRRTVRDAIAGLPILEAGERCGEDPLHFASRLSTINLERIRASSPGKTWMDWPGELLSPCHARVAGRSYTDVYGRMSWDSPSPTITTRCNGFGNGRFGHPEQDRAISLREAALLQTFPLDYEFFGPKERVSVTNAARWIGNAVPVALARALAKSVRIAVERAARI